MDKTIKLNNIELIARKDSSDNWNNSKYILKQGEFGWDIDNEILKVGNGIDLWSNLPEKNIDDYLKAKNKPKINDVELVGSMSLADIGIKEMTNMEIDEMFNYVFGSDS